MNNSRKFRVLQVLPTLSAGGAEGFITNLCVSLSELEVEVRVFIMAGIRGDRGVELYQRLVSAGIKVDGRYERNIRSILNIMKLCCIIISWKPNIIQANLYSAEILTIIAKYLSFNNNLIYVRRLANTRIFNKKLINFQKFISLCYDLNIACSQSVATEFYRSCSPFIKRNNLVTIMNGGKLLDAIPTYADKLIARQNLQIPENSFIVSHIGRMFGDENSPFGQKRHDLLLRAFAKAFANNSNCKLILVGDGPSRCKIESLARDLGIFDQTWFMGNQSEPWECLKVADVFAFPSQYEGLPNVLPEAASCGLPIIASDIKEIKDICFFKSWILVNSNNIDEFSEALIDVKNNIHAYRDKAHDAAEFYKIQFSMKKCAAEYVKCYNKMHNNF